MIIMNTKKAGRGQVELVTVHSGLGFITINSVKDTLSYLKMAPKGRSRV
jgi:hypothetical protein